jgi:MFS transporter, DHA1 family, multidrug resistance protein
VTTVVHPGDSLSGRQRLVYVIVLGALTALGPFTVDLYLPSFPLVQDELHTTQAMVQLTLIATTLGFALGQLVVGPWSDKVGRRAPLIIATAVHIAASLGIMFAPTIEWVGILRVLQGAGAAGGGVVAVAMVRDLFGGLPLVRMLARLSAVSGLAPVVAPLVGSQLLLLMDWRGIFAVLAVYGGLVVAAAIFFLVETQPPARRRDLGHATVRDRFGSLAKDHVYVGVVIVSAMTFTGLFAYLQSSPFIFQDFYEFTAQQYGLLFAVNSIGIVIGVQTSSRLVKYLGAQWVLLGAVTVQLLSAIAIVSLAMTVGTLDAVLVPLWFFILSCGFSFPCQQALALANHGGEAATAASVLGAATFGVAGVLAIIMGKLGPSSAMLTGSIMIVTATVSLLSFAIVIRPRTVPALSH